MSVRSDPKTTPLELVLAAAWSWLGTPWHHMGDADARAIKGTCVDCAMLLVEVYQAAGLIPLSVDPRPYDQDRALHKSDELFLGWMLDYADEVATPAAGDAVVWKYGRSFSHGGIVVGDKGEIIHAYRDVGIVTLGNLAEGPLAARPSKFFRIKGID